ncbi:Aminoglycoside N6'-acetyltransferase [Moritella sp. JT01]|uniref:GNAT family N-acetyltransferase n=1 Tax=Moritella sp. JT01 TaxID=756698 RepID=UPI0007980D5D|nr:GNAT family N-acetyltransferase [Moritella sp. JT01]KXO10884.1 Aminoglycoside N6'-acetyltransferase [Moritella sp. JT01]
MQLIQPLDNHIIEMMKWFSCEGELTDWSGPNFRYPYNLSSFTDDLNIRKLNSFSLVSSDSEFLAFGQYYQRLGKCHLGRLIVNPQFRGKGLVSKLIQQLCELGIKEFEVEECSLFVLGHNKNAIRAYEKFGFSFANYPEKIPLDNCFYMVKL